MLFISSLSSTQLKCGPVHGRKSLRYEVDRESLKMLCFLLVLLAFVSKLHVAIAAATEDEITNLPGWPSNVELPSKQYSGYVLIHSLFAHVMR